MDTIKVFEQAAQTLPQSQASVADYIVKHQLKIPFMKIEQLAHAVGVSTTTVMRLATNLGYSGYTDMIHPFKENLVKEATPLSKFAALNNSEKTNTDFAESVIAAETKMLSETINHNSYSTISTASSLIGKAKHVYVCGYRMSYMAMAYLYLCLHRVLENCVLLEPGSFDLLENISRIEKDDVVIGCVLPRYYSMVPPILKSAKEAGASTILLTDSYNSPASRFADICLMCACEGTSFHASIIGAIYLSDFIVACVAKDNPESTSTNLAKTEEILNEYRDRIT